MVMEKRLHFRKYWRARIAFEDEFGEGVIYLYSHNISLGGIFVEESPLLKMGTHLFLSFILPGKKRPMRITGKVVRLVYQDKGGGLQSGVGISFVELSQKNFAQLSQFLKH